MVAIEVAKSAMGRCNKCKSVIDKGALRLFIAGYKPNATHQSKYTHIECYKPYQKANTPKYFGELKGLEELDENQKEEVAEWVKKWTEAFHELKAKKNQASENKKRKQKGNSKKSKADEEKEGEEETEDGPDSKKRKTNSPDWALPEGLGPIWTGHILPLLSLSDICKLGEVNKNLNEIARSDAFWGPYTQRKFTPSFIENAKKEKAISDQTPYWDLHQELVNAICVVCGATKNKTELFYHSLLRASLCDSCSKSKNEYKFVNKKTAMKLFNLPGKTVDDMPYILVKNSIGKALDMKYYILSDLAEKARTDSKKGVEVTIDFKTCIIYFDGRPLLDSYLLNRVGTKEHEQVPARESRAQREPKNAVYASDFHKKR